jgi:hypothetical protein
MNSRHVKRIASPQANWGQREAYFALAMERRLWRGLRSFPGRPVYGRFPPNCGMHSAIRYIWFTSTPVISGAVKRSQPDQRVPRRSFQGPPST